MSSAFDLYHLREQRLVEVVHLHGQPAGDRAAPHVAQPRVREDLLLVHGAGCHLGALAVDDGHLSASSWLGDCS